MNPFIEKFLIPLMNEHGTLEAALQFMKANYNISNIWSKKYPELFMLKYSIDSPFSEEIVRKCRGIIINSETLDVISLPYDKFFNYGEGHASKIYWDKVQVYEKLDGSLCSLYWYGGEWNVATSGSPDASGQVGNFPFTFEELFWKTWNELEYKFPTVIWVKEEEPFPLTFMFELMTPYNKIVVPHTSNQLIFHGARWNKGGEDATSESMFLRAELDYGWKVVKTFSGLESLDMILKEAETINGLESEGFIVFDGTNRIKIKSPDYVALHHMKSGMGEKAIIDLVKSGEESEVGSYFPEFKDLIADVTEKLSALEKKIEQLYREVEHHETDKDFAMAVLQTDVSNALFNMRKTGVSAREWIKSQSADKLMKYLMFDLYFNSISTSQGE